MSMDKETQEVEEIAPARTHTTNNELGIKSTYYDAAHLSRLTQEHRDYLLKRHGTLDLDPIPSNDPADPYNWPQWKKSTNLYLVAFHAMMTTFTAAAIIPAFGEISADLNISLVRASYLTSMQIVLLGFAPLIWKPLSYKYGRRPIWLISTIGSGICNVGCAVSPSYGTMALCRCLVSFFVSPPIAIGSGVVVETCFTKERGRYMGIWTLMVTLGPPGGPFIMGFVAEHIGYRWIYWILAIINLAQFVLFFFLGPETRYIRQGISHTGSSFKRTYLNFRRIDPNPLRAYEFIQPFSLARYMTILLPTISYSLVFGFTSVFLTVEIPQIFIPKFEFTPQPLGLQFLGMIIGSLIGEQLGGPLSDWWMRRQGRKLTAAHSQTAHVDAEGAGQTGKNASVTRRPSPEYRLWLSYPALALVVCGLLVFGIRTQQAPQRQWNVTPIVGIAIAAAGNQILTTVLVTYAVDCHPEQSSSVGVFVNIVRSTWGFIGPFWFPDMIESLGESGSGGLMAGICGVVGGGLVVLVQVLGGRWRRKREVRERRIDATDEK